MSDDELKAFLAVGRHGEQLLAAEILALRAKQLQLLKQLAAAEEALRWIADPIAALQREAKAAGRALDPPMALRLAESAQYLRSRAAAALRALEGKDG